MTNDSMNGLVAGNLSDIQLAFHCAPLFMGLRISVFMMISKKQEKSIHEMILGMNLSMAVISRRGEKMGVLIYHPDRLLDYFKEPRVKELLRTVGYEEGDFIHCIGKFSKHYQNYLEGKQEFPHEMGIFLGYPPEDVRGYLNNSGSNFLCSGYWKVYENESVKKQLFERMDKAGRFLMSLLVQGMNLYEAVTLIQTQYKEAVL